VLVVEDGAGFHVPAREGHPLGLEIIALPAYSPELQRLGESGTFRASPPVERLWQLTDATVVNRCFDTLDHLTDALAQRCAWLETQPDMLTHQTLFHWWPLLRN